MSTDGESTMLTVYRQNADDILALKDPMDSEAATLTEERVQGMTKAQLVNQLIVLARFSRRAIEAWKMRSEEYQDTIERGQAAEKRHVERIQELSTQLNQKQNESHERWQELLTLREENQRLDLLSEKRLSRKVSRKAGELWGKLDDKTQQP